MHKKLMVVTWFSLIGLTGCATDSSERNGPRSFAVAPSPGRVSPDSYAGVVKPSLGVVKAGYTTTDPPSAENGTQLPAPNLLKGEKTNPKAGSTPMSELALADLINMTTERNPRLAQVG